LGSDANFISLQSIAPEGRAKGTMNLDSDPKNLPAAGATGETATDMTVFSQKGKTLAYPVNSAGNMRRIHTKVLDKAARDATPTPKTRQQP
jgi:hypothetical protein